MSDGQRADHVIYDESSAGEISLDLEPPTDEQLVEWTKLAGQYAEDLKSGEIAPFSLPMDRKSRRARGERNHNPVRLAGEVDWNDGRMTVESFPSVRAVKRVSGGRLR